MRAARGDVQALEARLAEVTRLRDRCNDEIDSICAGLRMHGALRGRPRVRSVMSSEEAKAAHSAWICGNRSTWAEEGHRQYKREAQRRYRQAAA